MGDNRNASGLSNDALVVMEIDSIARGYVVLDALVKRAETSIHLAQPVTPGKFVIVFHGLVADVEESLEAARETAGSQLIDDIHLPMVHEALLQALAGHVTPEPGEAIGIAEFATIAATIHGADVALKSTTIAVIKMHLAMGIGGKGYFSIAGTQADIEAAMDAVKSALEPTKIVATEIIARPHAEIRGFLS